MTIYIDQTPVECQPGQTVLEAALAADIYIPHLCTHPDLTTQGECKLCIVSIEGRGIVCSCETQVEDGMRITTKSEELHRRRGVALELMLAGHPHDCTSCKLYSKCELQAMTQYLGVVHSRMRSVHRKSSQINRVSPLIIREMERCIQCGRCVRACGDLRGVGILHYNKLDGETYIGTEGDVPLTEADCRFCGACVEVCPTGALQDVEGIFRSDLPREEALVPCRAECPAGTDIPAYLRFVKEGKYSEAVAVVREKLPFPHALGYVCTHYCEKGCKHKGLNSPVAVRDLKRFAVEHDDQQLWKKNSVHMPPTGKRVAVVGAGPCGMTAAYYLAKKGHDVTVLERLPVAGGMMSTGIPAYRLPRQDVQREIDEILAAGVKLQTGVDVKDVRALKEEGYDAVLVAVGAAAGKVIPLEGYQPQQGTTAVEFLRAVALGQETPLVGPGRNVTVLGGGNVAFDAARTARRLGAQVNVVCLEDRAHMLSDEEEITGAQEEGVQVFPGKSNLRIENDGATLTGLVTIDVASFRFEDGKLMVETVPGTESVIPTDTVIFATGQKTDLTPEFGLELNRFGYPVRAENGCGTSLDGVYAAGDVVTGTKAVVDAIAGGRRAAQEIDLLLGGDGNIEEHLVDRTREPNIGREEGFAQRERVEAPLRDPQSRVQDFAPVGGSLTCDQARCEAGRCLQCDLRGDITRVKVWTEYSVK